MCYILPLTENSPRALQPDGIKVELKPHQLADLKRMRRIEKGPFISMSNNIKKKIETRIGILGDATGYGKTLTALALISSTKNRIETPRNRYYGGFYSDEGLIRVSYTFPESTVPGKCSLVIVPPRLIKQWKEEIKRTDLRCLTFTSRTLKKHLTELNTVDGVVPISTLDEYDLFLVSSTKWRDYSQYVQNYFWKRIIIDEIDSISLPSFAYYRHINREIITRTDACAGFYWGLTATWEVPQKNNQRGQVLLYKFVTCLRRPPRDIKDSIIVRSSPDFLHLSYSMPSPEIHYISVFTPAFLQKFQGAIPQEALERLNAGDMEGAILSMGGKIQSTDTVLSLLTERIKDELKELKAQLQLQNIRLERSLRRSQPTVLITENIAKTERIIHEKEEVITSIEERIENKECDICADDINNPVVLPCCSHVLCLKCIMSWLDDKDTCPYCRSVIDGKKLIMLGHEKERKTIETREFKKIDTKADVLLRLLKENPERRYLIFSDYDGSFQEVEDLFNKNGIRYSLVKGSVEQSNKIIECFTKKEINVLLLNSRFNAAGLNLQMTDDIVLYHQLAQSVQTQVIGRAYRMGRTSDMNPVRVWCLAYAHEYPSIEVRE